MAQIQWAKRKQEIQEMLDTKGADYVCEHFSVNRKHLITVCNDNGIRIEKKHKRKHTRMSEPESAGDLPRWLIKRRNEHLRRATL
jgi:hypothetical protein